MKRGFYTLARRAVKVRNLFIYKKIIIKKSFYVNSERSERLESGQISPGGKEDNEKAFSMRSPVGGVTPGSK